jgi:Xaa-Pro aminopeptidase
MKNFIRLLIGAGESDADIRYAAGISTPDSFIFFSHGNRKCAIMSPLEIDRARRTAKPGVAVGSEADFNGPKRLNILLAIAGQCRCRDFIVPGDFPLALADQMRAAGLTVTPSDTGFFPEREFKSADEAACITAAPCDNSDAYKCRYHY